MCLGSTGSSDVLQSTSNLNVAKRTINFDFHSNLLYCCLTVTVITSLEKKLGNFSDPALNFYQNFVLYHFKNM